MANNLFIQKLSTKITDSMVGFAFKVYIGNKFILVKVNQ
jgi:ribosomal protein S19